MPGVAIFCQVFQAGEVAALTCVLDISTRVNHVVNLGTLFIDVMNDAGVENGL